MPKGSHKSKKNHKKSTARKTAKKQNKTINKPIIVGLIYAEWCGHCKDMKKDWENLTIFLKGKVAKIHEIESTDADKESIINKLNNKYSGERLQGNSFPVIFKIKNNKIQTYNGKRDFESMKSWVFAESEPEDVLEIMEERVLEPTEYNGNKAKSMVMEFLKRIRGGYQYNTPKSPNSPKSPKSPNSPKKSKSSKSHKSSKKSL